MDFSSYGLAEDVVQKLTADYEADVAGLKSKITEKTDAVKSLKVQLKSTEDEKLEALEAAENAKIAQAEKDGDVEAYKKAIKEKEDAIDTLKSAILERENDILIGEQLTGFSKLVADNEAAQFFMSAKFKDSIEVKDGEVRPKDASLTLEALTNKFVSDENYKSYIKANVGSGAGAAGSNGGGAPSKKFADMSATEKAVFANQNPELYAQMKGAN